MKLRRTLTPFIAWISLAAFPAEAPRSSGSSEGGDRIEYSSPVERSLNRPLTERDLGSRLLNFQRGSENPQNEFPMSPLPQPDQVNRTRALMELLERSGSFSSDDATLNFGDDPTADPFANVGSLPLGIDDLFQNQGSRDNRRRPSFDQRSRDSQGFEPSSTPHGSLSGPLENSQRFDTSPSERRANEFLPGFGSQNPLDNDRSATGANGPPRSFLDVQRDLNRTPSGALDPTGARSREERGERMDNFRRWLNATGSGSTTLGINNANTSPSSSVNDSSLWTLPTGSGPAAAYPGASRATSDSLSGSPDANRLDGNLTGPLQMPTGFVSPQRPSQLDLSITRDSRRPDRLAPASTPPPSSPMQLFQQKHDTRIPSRVF